MTATLSVLAVLVAVLAGGCGLLNRDAAATWVLAPGQTLEADATTFGVLVTRLGCNSGVTGEVNAPDIEVTEDRVVITFTVSPGEPSSATCQGNNPVPYEVELPEKVGGRVLVDGQCTAGEAVGTEPCRADGVRHSP